MKELTLKQKKRALKYIIEEFKDETSRVDFICEGFEYWYKDNIDEDLNHYEYMKSFPELFNKIAKRLKRQNLEVSYIKKEIASIDCLNAGSIDRRKYRINLLEQIQKEIGV